MDRSKRTHRYDTTRSPLAEKQPRATPSSVRSKQSCNSKLTSSPGLPHHESMRPDGNLSVISRNGIPSSSPVHANKRVIAIHEDETESSKRDSQISTTSTASNATGKRKTHIGPWQLGRTLGEGATSRVRLAKHALSGEKAAIKIVSKKSAALVSSASMRRMDDDVELSNSMAGTRTMPFGIEREIVIMKLIEHPHLISLYDVWENRGELYLVMEYVEGGELFGYISRNQGLQELEAVRLLRQILSGLAYCHRFNICHRDLKPENILLDKDHNIKIADFGMAALQPNGQYLSTACGSPHYAAPEIVSGKQYQGSKVDIWSAGIIFYAMLVGFLPFDGEGTSEVMAKIRKGEYYLPDWLSPEAQDLIQAMLLRNPKNRISMPEIWKHPLLKKYDRLLTSMLAPGQKLPGPPPPLTYAECGPRKIHPAEIDRDLLRNLQILWHGMNEKEVIKRLTDNEPNYEKLFYWALVRFEEEQLENFHPAEELHYSASDYHHSRSQKQRLPRSATRSTLHKRRNSQFSIVSEENIQRKTYYRNPHSSHSEATQRSYDPFRASRTPLVHGAHPGTVVTVTRPGSCRSGRRVYRRGSSIASAEIPELPSFNAIAMQKLLLQQKRATFSTVSSRGSFASTQGRHTFTKSPSHRRNVVFQHRRRSASHHDASQSSTPRPSISRPTTRDSSQTVSDSRSTPSIPTPQQVVRTKRPASDLNLTHNRSVRGPYSDAARQVSAELSKICEVAFNRSSLSCASDSSHQPTTAYNSPATTVSISDAVLATLSKSSNPKLAEQLRDLVDRRQRIIDTWGDGDAQTLADLLDTLDRRISHEHSNIEALIQRRAASDPTHIRRLDGPTRLSDCDTMTDLKIQRGQQRAVSHPVHGTDYNTIRMVSPDPTSPLRSVSAKPNKAMPLNSLQGHGFDRAKESYDKRLLTGQSLDPILEDPPKSPRRSHNVEKKWSWLSKKAMSSNDELPPTPPRKDTPKDAKFRDIANSSTTSVETRSTEASSGGDGDAKKKTWLNKVFNMRKKDKTLSIDGEHKVVSGNADDVESLNDLLTPGRRAPTRRGHRVSAATDGLTITSTSTNPETTQSWFARLLHLKPAARVLVMSASKAQGRREIVKVLREWRKFGIKDLAVERHPTGDVIRARVDAENYLRIRPVTFTAVVFTVLERGKASDLSIVKFTQEKGAASSFNRVVDTMESVMKENGCILEDAIKRKKIMKSMKQAGL